MLTKLLLSLLRAKLEDALRDATSKDVLTIKGVAHSVKIAGARYTLDVVARREKDRSE